MKQHQLGNNEFMFGFVRDIQASKTPRARARADTHCESQNQRLSLQREK